MFWVPVFVFFLDDLLRVLVSLVDLLSSAASAEAAVVSTGDSIMGLGTWVDLSAVVLVLVRSFWVFWETTGFKLVVLPCGGVDAEEELSMAEAVSRGTVSSNTSTHHLHLARSGVVGDCAWMPTGWRRADAVGGIRTVGALLLGRCLLAVWDLFLSAADNNDTPCHDRSLRIGIPEASKQAKSTILVNDRSKLQQDPRFLLILDLRVIIVQSLCTFYLN